MTDTREPLSLHILRELRGAIRHVNREHREGLSPLQQVALWITNHVGTRGFFLVIFIWTAVWLSWNALAPDRLRFDPFPAFVLWLFISNMVQIFLMPLIMVGQNLQARHSEARAEAEFELATRAGREIETILLHLERQNEYMVQILKRLDAEQQPTA